MVQAVTHLTLDHRVPAEIQQRLEQRIWALGSAHDILIKNEWCGAGLEALARQQLAAYMDDVQRQLSLSGPSVILPPELATPLGLVLHEPATNAAKYGALSSQHGHVALTWEIRNLEGGLRLLDLTWTESGGPHVDPPTVKGAGSALIEHGLARAEVERKFEAGGLICRIKVPLTPPSA